MAHLPYADPGRPEIAPLVERIVAERGGVLHPYVQVPSGQMQALRTQLDDRQVVELVGTIAAYHMVSRFLEALHIHAADARPAGPAASKRLE